MGESVARRGRLSSGGQGGGAQARSPQPQVDLVAADHQHIARARPQIPAGAGETAEVGGQVLQREAGAVQGLDLPDLGAFLDGAGVVAQQAGGGEHPQLAGTRLEEEV
ncbi:MAG: hypothetical protein C4328_09195 [Meiothermus sp.]